MIDITKCKPGAVVCDVARPPDINPAEAALRPDVLVIESGEVIIPGDVDFRALLGLALSPYYACLAETACLAMDGRFEDYTLGRNITMERVKDIYKTSLKHGFKLAPLRSFGKYVSEADLAARRALAEQYRRDPALFTSVRTEAQRRLQDIPIMAKGVKQAGSFDKRWLTVGAVGAALGAVALAIAGRGKK